ncbi:MAG: AI-2E family transporter [Opitutaceae bacterium]|jgi:predicted PurR-regulated permease PerM
MSEIQETRLLNPSQRRMVGFALGLLALVGTIALLVYSVAKLGQLLSYFSSVLWPLAVAGILALILRPIVEILEKKLRLKRLAAVMVLYGAVTLAVAAALLFITPSVVSQVLDFIAFAPTFWKNGLIYVEDHYPQWVELASAQMSNPHIRDAVDGMLRDGQELIKHMIPSLKSAGMGAIGVISFITHLAIVPIYLFFFLLSSHEPTRNLHEQLPFLSPKIREDVVFLAGQFITIVVSFFRGQLLIGLIMGALLAIGFTLVGLKFGLVIGLALGILNIVPYLGTIIGLSIALPLAFLQPGGDFQQVGLVIAVFCLVQMIEGWYLTPKIMGDRTGLHPVAIIVSIFFWGAALNGILGMVLAIPLTAFFVTAWRLAKHKYIKPASEQA